MERNASRYAYGSVFMNEVPWVEHVVDENALFMDFDVIDDLEWVAHCVTFCVRCVWMEYIEVFTS